MNKNIQTLLVALISGFTGAGLYDFFVKDKNDVYIQSPINSSSTPVSYTSEKKKEDAGNIETEDFVQASALSTPSVVFIKTISAGNYEYNNFEWLFGNGTGAEQVTSAGSGVIYSQDGYIITNNHVIEKSEKIEVVHEKKSYAATIVGRDPSTDLAVLKIQGMHLPAVKFGISKNLRVGEWVLAVGNPFNLNSTVTAGIVSAKTRNINVVNSQFPIESFIQTDAAINPGNSGGALVNTKGELVGINTAILSRTGSYAGYGFAVPADIVSKVVKDLITYGEVQKAFTGLEVGELTSSIAEKLNLESLAGVVITYIQKEGAAEKAGLKKGDVISKINDTPIDSKSAFEEQLSFYSPGEKIKIQYNMPSGSKEVQVTLTNREGTTELLKKETVNSKTLGAELEPVSKVERDKMGISSGVRINSVSNGLIRRLGISEGFIITSINKLPIHNPADLTEILQKIRGKVIIEGVTSNGVRGYYSFYF